MDRNQVASSALPGLYRLTAAAAIVGISADLLESAIRCGDAPLELVKLGERGLLFVRASELHAWLKWPMADHQADRRATPWSPNETPYMQRGGQRDTLRAMPAGRGTSGLGAH
ncbi:hypothetical protein PO002_35450 [Cupriavidus necator]|uniref:hypothetical protein n=1 Tax=Cupriavidus necator TaxID=106590 RepID=UPI0039C1D41E